MKRLILRIWAHGVRTTSWDQQISYPAFSFNDKAWFRIQLAEELNISNIKLNTLNQENTTKLARFVQKTINRYIKCGVKLDNEKQEEIIAMVEKCAKLLDFDDSWE